MIGAGTPARFELPALIDARKLDWVVVLCSRKDAVLTYTSEMTARFGALLESAGDLMSTVKRAAVITTSACEALFDADVARPMTIATAVGSDMPGEQELPTASLAHADRYICDRVEPCAFVGESGQALEAGLTAR